MSEVRITPGGSDFRLMDRKAISVFRRFREHSRFIRGIVGGLGFRQTTLSFKAPARHAGTSKFSLRKNASSGYGWHHYQFDGTASYDLLYRIPGSLCRAADDYIRLLLSHCGHYRTGLVNDGDSPGNLRQCQPHGSGILGEYIGRILKKRNSGRYTGWPVIQRRQNRTGPLPAGDANKKLSSIYRTNPGIS